MTQREVNEMVRGKVLTKAVPKALEAGATPSQICRAAAVMGYTRAAATHALRKAGVSGGTRAKV